MTESSSGHRLPEDFPRERIQGNVVRMVGDEVSVVADVFHELEWAFARETSGVDNPPHWQPTSQHRHRGHFKVYLWIVADRAVGFLIGAVNVPDSCDNPVPAVILSIYVSPGHRRQGVARGLVTAFSEDYGVSPDALAWGGLISSSGSALAGSFNPAFRVVS